MHHLITSHVVRPTWLLTSSCLTALMLFMPTQVLAVAYGVGHYGQGDYNVGIEENTGSAKSSSTSSSKSASCSSATPNSSPDLFQINPGATELTLFFTPASGERDRYFISYGETDQAETHGAEYMNSSNGVISVTIRSLAPNTTYYFKVRAGNGCQPGDWGNTLSARTGQRSPTYRWVSVPQVVVSEVARHITPPVKKTEDQASPVSTVPAPAPTPTTLPTNTQPTPTPIPPALPKTDTPPARPPSLLTKVFGFIKGLFK